MMHESMIDKGTAQAATSSVATSEQAEKILVLIVDDHTILRAGLTLPLKRGSSCERIQPRI